MTTETMQFQAEVAQLLHLVTHSLYSNKEIFLRELISNASDAADKLRYEGLSDQALFENDSDLSIWIRFDKDARTITIRDNGIGMSRDEIIENLGTIAKSGTREFLKAMADKDAKDRNLIGQFGVGFYSAYVVADTVTVRSRRAGMKADQGVEWASDGTGEFTIENITREQRGTEITLHLKDDADEFLDHFRLRNVINKYSDHIPLPIMMEKPDAEDKENKEENKQTEWETVNKATALWTLPKSQIKDEEYQELYKHIGHDFEDPLAWSHNKVEGKLEYTSLLYIPKRAPFDMFQRDHRRGLKLYVKRVFIMDDAEQLMPVYLRFIRGIVDSNDLPLNVSREILQNNKVIETMRAGCVKRVLDMLEKMAKNEPEKYAEFWQQFGQALKEGPVEDFANKDKIAKLLRFASTHNDSPEQNVSLDDYIGRMQKGQDKIFFVTADTFNAAKNSPHLEWFRKKGIEVLLLTDRIDEWMTGHLTEYEGKQLQSVAKADVDLGELADEKDEEETKKEQDAFDSVIKQMKETLGEKVSEVKLTDRLTDSPACLAGNTADLSMHMQRILAEAGQAMPAQAPIFEINPKHALIEKLQNEADTDRFNELTELLFDQAFLAEGGQLEDPATFVKRVNKLLVE